MLPESHSRTRRRTGILGGTFDPIHLGHLLLAEETRCALQLDQILFIPAAQPWRKAGRAVSPAEARFAMVRLAIEDNPYFSVSRAELDRQGLTYTAETLEELRAGSYRDGDLWFILGSDALLDLPHWREPARIIQLARLAVACRSPLSPEQIAVLEQAVPGIGARIDIVPMPRIEISSSTIRQRLRTGGATRYWLPATVDRYAREHGLYRPLPSEEGAPGAAAVD